MQTTERIKLLFELWQTSGKILNLKFRQFCFWYIPSPPTPPNISMCHLISPIVTKEMIHKTDLMILLKKSKHQNMRNILYLNHIYYYYFLTQNRIRFILVEISFISIPKDIYFGHYNTWWIKITTKICCLFLLQVNLSRRTLFIYSCIWNFFVIEI